MAPGPNWRCDAVAVRRVARPAMLAAIAGLVAFYAVALAIALTPKADEAFRRTYLTREFGAYPTSPAFGGANALAYRLGDRVVFDGERPRLLLSPLDWTGTDEEGALLAGLSGRLFLNVVDGAAASRQRLTLTLDFVCAMPRRQPARLVVAVNDFPVGFADCRRGPVTARFVVPVGRIGVHDYDKITINREPAGLGERIATRFGLRRGVVTLAALTLTPLP